MEKFQKPGIDEMKKSLEKISVCLKDYCGFLNDYKEKFSHPMAIEKFTQILFDAQAILHEITTSTVALAVLSDKTAESWNKEFPDRKTDRPYQATLERAALEIIVIEMGF